MELQLQFRFPPHHRKPQLKALTDHLLPLQPEPHPPILLPPAQIVRSETEWQNRALRFRNLGPSKTLLPISRLRSRRLNPVKQVADRDLGPKLRSKRKRACQGAQCRFELLISPSIKFTTDRDVLLP